MVPYFCCTALSTVLVNSWYQNATEGNSVTTKANTSLRSLRWRVLAKSTMIRMLVLFMVVLGELLNSLMLGFLTYKRRMQQYCFHAVVERNKLSEVPKADWLYCLLTTCWALIFAQSPAGRGCQHFSCLYSQYGLQRIALHMRISPACLTLVFASISETVSANGNFPTVLPSLKLQLL